MSVVDIPDLPEKARLLYGHASYRKKDDQAVTIDSQKDLAAAIGWDAAKLSRALGGDPPYLPRAKIPAFLRLYGLDVPDPVSDEWVAIAALTFEFFLTAVKQRGGLAFLRSPWDRFVANTLRQDKQGRNGDAGLRVESAPAADWVTPAHPGVSLRFLAPGQPNPAASGAAGMPVHYIGDRARFELDVGQVLTLRPLQVLIFQDIVFEADGQRRFIPLLPSPPTRFRMPDPVIGGRHPGDDVLFLPSGTNADPPQLFEVPAGWGLQRRVTAVVTANKITDDIYTPADGWEIGPDRLDRLAQHLAHDHFGPWALFVYDYLVRPRSPA